MVSADVYQPLACIHILAPVVQLHQDAGEASELDGNY